jgi:hypothetical protein
MAMRSKILLIIALLLAVRSQAASLPSQQIKTFREWMVLIAEDQIRRGVNPRWQNPDCAGLVRFAVNEALIRHDDKWRAANGFMGRALPAELEIPAADKEIFKQWRTNEGETSRFVRAITLVQRNSQFIGKTIERLEPGDFAFFDQGDEQHVILWTGRRFIYHNGSRPKERKDPADNGLRTASFNDFLSWKDTRWRMLDSNPNFIGFYRLSFLSNRMVQESL